MRKEPELTPYIEDSEAKRKYEALHPQRVLVVPIRPSKGKFKSKRGLFALIFGYGSETISKGFDLIVIWDETNKKIDYEPMKKFIIRDEGRPPFSLSKEKMEEMSKSASLWANGMLNTPRHKRKALIITLERINQTLQTRKGFWLKEPLSDSVFDMTLRNQTNKSSLKLLFANDTPLTVRDFMTVEEDSSFLLLRDVEDARYAFKSSLRPDPYSIVRSFLGFIGIYPNRQGGSRIRKGRMTEEDAGDIIVLLRKKCGWKKPSSLDVKDAFKEVREVKYDPTQYLIKKLQKLSVRRSYKPFPEEAKSPLSS